jgi:hypothetical protein
MTTPTKKTLRLLNFYAGTGLDDEGRGLREIQAWPDERLEQTHDYIQWLFPLAERSSFNIGAPILDKETIHAFRSSPELRENLRASFVRMLRFYGFALAEQRPPRVVTAPAFPDRARVWLSWGNHNHLRITRILKSMTILGLEQEAEAFLAALEDLYSKVTASQQPLISAETMVFWREAVGRT